MDIRGIEGDSYLFLNGLSVDRPVHLRPLVVLLPAACSPDPGAMIRWSENEVALGTTRIFLRRVSSQLRVTEPDAKKHAALAWNAQRDALLLSALFDCQVVCNFQSDTSANQLDDESDLRVTNYHLRHDPTHVGGFVRPAGGRQSGDHSRNRWVIGKTANHCAVVMY